MAKTVFRPGEAKFDEAKLILPLSRSFAPEVEEVETVEEEYTGPTADELRREAEEFKISWEAEKQRMMDEARAQADEIVRKAGDTAFEEVKRQTDQAQVIKADAENEAQDIISKAQAQAQQIVAEAQAQNAALIGESRRQGYEEGQKEGYDSGLMEVNRLIDRMHKIVESVMQRREEILQDTESQIVELVILMSRKVIKILSENQKNIVIANTLDALKKVKSRGKVTLRVNMEDVKLTSQHVSDFIQHVENVEAIDIMEDSSVERGGCIVETDFGAIDARISSQLKELENKILEVSPVKNIRKTDALTDEN